MRSGVEVLKEAGVGFPGADAERERFVHVGDKCSQWHAALLYRCNSMHYMHVATYSFLNSLSLSLPGCKIERVSRAIYHLLVVLIDL